MPARNDGKTKPRRDGGREQQYEKNSALHVQPDGSLDTPLARIKEFRPCASCAGRRDSAGEGRDSGNASHFEPFFLEQGSDSGGLIALKLNAALACGATAAAGLAELAGQLLNHGHGNGRREVVDDNHCLPAAMRLFAPQYHPPQSRLAGRRPDLRRRLPARRQTVHAQAGEWMVPFRLMVLGQGYPALLWPAPISSRAWRPAWSSQTC